MSESLSPRGVLPGQRPSFELFRASFDQHAALHVIRMQRAVVAVQTRSREGAADTLAGLHHLDFFAIQQSHGVGEVVVVRPCDGGAGGHDDVFRSELVRPRQIDLCRGHGSVGLCALAGDREESNEEDGECRAEGVPDTRAEDRKHGRQREPAAPAVARRTVQLKIRMNASRSSTSLTVWANRKTVQSRWYVM